MKFKVGDRVKFIGDIIDDLKPGYTGRVIEAIEGDSWKYVEGNSQQTVEEDMYVVNWRQKVKDEYVIAAEWLEAI